MKVSILTLGCKVNQAEMSEIEGRLRGQGHQIVGLAENPDVCVINTCTVTAKSDYQSRQLIRRAGRTGARVIVTGCYSEINPEKVSRMEGVERVVDNANKEQIISAIDTNHESINLKPVAGRTRYFLKVQDGCNNSCSYCIVHVARGRSRSVTPEIIVDKINKAVEEGFKEVVLTGIHLGQYGCDMPDGFNLTHLISEILDKTGVPRLRLSSLEVNEVSDSLLKHFNNQRVMPHLHIPLQSGDDGVLKLMNRHYDTDLFRDTVMRIHNRLPEIALGTDIIAGFPQESEDAFHNTLSMAGELPFTYMHIFPYSKRPGTPAAEMKDIVGDDNRKKRASELRAIAQRKKSLYMERQHGRTLDMLIEDTTKDDICRGTSCNYLRIEMSCNGHTRGSVVPVRISGLREGKLIGKPVK